jgi:hypothetical protein
VSGRPGTLGLVVVELHPGWVDVHLHALDRAGPLQQLREVLHIERRAVHVDNPAVLGNAETGAPDVIPAAERRAEVAFDVLVEVRRDLALVYQQLKVLPDALD